jgi:serine protease Do
VVPLTPKTEAPNEARALSRAFANVARAVGPSVVRVDVEVMRPDRGEESGAEGGGLDPGDVPPLFRRFFQFGEPGPPAPRRGTGSGVVLDGAGNIVTNRHVVSGASKVGIVLPDGRELTAKVVGADSQTDVAVVRLEKPPADLVAARLGDSDKLEVGEWVLAVGSPLGLDQTVTAGIVSGKGRVGRRVHMSGDRVRRYIQTDAKINPGNSGGPLVNLNAEVVGLNTLINTGPGGAYGFAIPITQVRRVAEAIIKDGRVRYPYLGVLVGDLEDLDAGKRAALSRSGALPAAGAFVSEVTAGGPAAKSGLRAGDVIVELDGQRVESAGDVIDYVSSKAIGAKVQLTFVRDGKKAPASVVLGELPDREVRAADGGPTAFGLALQTLTPRLAESLGLGPATKGAVVTEVAPGSPAEKAELGVGDVIVEIDRKPVATAEEATGLLGAPRKGGHLLRVRGPGGTRFVTLGD